MKKSVALLFFLFIKISPIFSSTVNLWHGYRGQEKAAIESVTRAFNLAHEDVQVKLLAVPFDALNDKLQSTIPLGNGPDVFVFAQDYIGTWAEQGLIIPLESYLTPGITQNYFGKTIQAMNYMYDEAVWGLPGSFKNIALFYNKDKIKNPPQKMSEIIAVSKNFTKPNKGQFGQWGFVYENRNFYYHTMWIQGFGGKIFRSLGMHKGSPLMLPLIYSRPIMQAGKYVLDNVIRSGICPEEPSGTLVTQLFNTGNAMFVVNGQWFRGEIEKNINYGLSKLPIIDSIGKRAIPFITVEGYFMASCSKNQVDAVKVIEYYTSAAMGKVMAQEGKQTPANKGAYKYSVVNNDAISTIFKDAATVAISMPNVPEMSFAWGAGGGSLGDMLNGEDPETATKRHQIEIMRMIEESKKIPGAFKSLGYDYNKLTAPLPVD